ncbi:hypothetical protein [Synechococcus sp. MIT S9451]|uniref:hypothetical protein n=1 Tax=Synechococcus sp. MIT S9451 TaxID=3082543 RepID=UPI0039B509B8
MDFTLVILNQYVSAYPQMEWTEWKDSNRKKMKSQGDNWSKTTLPGDDIWDCLNSYKIDSRHLVQWKPAADTLYRVSLPSQ